MLFCGGSIVGSLDDRSMDRCLVVAVGGGAVVCGRNCGRVRFGHIGYRLQLSFSVAYVSNDGSVGYNSCRESLLQPLKRICGDFR